MFKVVFLAVIVGVTIIRTAQASNYANESECRENIEQELREYIKSYSWQQLLSQHFKFIVNEDGAIISKMKRLKFNTIIHNALYGCNHLRDDEVEDCPNIYRGSIKSCEYGRNLRSAMFRAARCRFTESAVKHIVLSDGLLNVYPSDKLKNIFVNVDRPIREFGETVVNMLNVLAHGEMGGIGDLMALNLYLNNIYGTVLMYKVPTGPIDTLEEFENAKKHSRDVHRMIIEKLYTFWDTWCSDIDVVTQYRSKYADKRFEIVLDEIDKNIDETDEFIRCLNVHGNVVDGDFDIYKILLTQYVNGLILNKSMPVGLLKEIQLNAFEASFEFDPQALYANYHKSVFRSIHTVFYWTTITHLKLGVQFIDGIEQFSVSSYNKCFMMKFVKIVRPLLVFDINQLESLPRLPREALTNINTLITFLVKMYYDLKYTHSKTAIIMSARPEIQKFVRLLSTDAEKLLGMKVPDYYFEHLSYDCALELMQSNYQAFTRLISATSSYKEDRRNINKIKRFFYFLNHTVSFREIE